MNTLMNKTLYRNKLISRCETQNMVFKRKKYKHDTSREDKSPTK